MFIVIARPSSIINYAPQTKTKLLTINGLAGQIVPRSVYKFSEPHIAELSHHAFHPIAGRALCLVCNYSPDIIITEGPIKVMGRCHELLTFHRLILGMWLGVIHLHLPFSFYTWHNFLILYYLEFNKQN